MRAIIPDFIQVGVGFDAYAIVGAGVSFEANWTLRGKDASLKPVYTTTLSVGGGYDIDATVNLGGSTYLGPVSDISKDMIPGVSYWGSAAIAAGGNIGLTGFYQPTSTGLGVVGATVNIGGGIPFGPLPFNASGGVSTTNVIH